MCDGHGFFHWGGLGAGSRVYPDDYDLSVTPDAYSVSAGKVNVLSSSFLQVAVSCFYWIGISDDLGHGQRRDGQREDG